MITLTFYVLFLYGCYTIDSLEMSDANLENFDGDRIISIITNDSIIYEFENNEFKPKPYIADSTLIGWIKTESMGDPLDVEEVQIPISEIKTLNFETTAYLNNQISFQLGSQNPIELKLFLSQYLPEDLDRTESLTETLARSLKI